jgi:hypothetical protein
MWYPNRAQWVAIWISAGVALLLWVFSIDIGSLPTRLAFAVLVVGGLSVWQLARRPFLSAQVPSAPPVLCPACQSPVATAAIGCKCGEILLPEADKKRLNGPRGWLGWICLLNLVIGPVMVAISLASALRSAYGSVAVIRAVAQSTLAIMSVAYGFYAGMSLYRRWPFAVMRARNSTVFIAMCGVGSAALGYLPGRTEEVAIFAMSAFVGLTAMALWLWYFNKSRRVLVTYGVDETRRPLPKRMLLAAAAFVVIVVATALLAPRLILPDVSREWTLYSPSGVHFQVVFPAKPKEATRKVDTGAGAAVMHIAVFETPDLALTSGYYDLPKTIDTQDVSRTLETIRDHTVSATNSTLVDSRRIKVSEVPGLEYTAKAPRASDIRARIFLAGQRVFVGISLTRQPASARVDEVSDRFVMSFMAF